MSNKTHGLKRVIKVYVPSAKITYLKGNTVAKQTQTTEFITSQSLFQENNRRIVELRCFQ